MKLVTFQHGGAAYPGLWRGDRVLSLSPQGAGGFSSMLDFIAAGEDALSAARRWQNNAPGSSWLAAADVNLLAPIPRPARNVFCVGRNYLDHVKEGAEALKVDLTLPKAPTFFTKQPNAVIGPGAEISIATAVSEAVDYEVELGVVIGRPGRDIAPDRVSDHILGYTIVNDITARDLQTLHGQWFRGKALDTSCPMGPWIVTADEIENVRALVLTCAVNGELRQTGKVEQMIFDIPTIVSTLSSGMRLEAGDIIATGTPSGVGFAMKPPRLLNDGDVVTCEISGIGMLTNQICRPA